MLISLNYTIVINVFSTCITGRKISLDCVDGHGNERASQPVHPDGFTLHMSPLSLFMVLCCRKKHNEVPRFISYIIIYNLYIASIYDFLKLSGLKLTSLNVYIVNTPHQKTHLYNLEKQQKKKTKN
jgi:hypothetical protein